MLKERLGERKFNEKARGRNGQRHDEVRYGKSPGRSDDGEKCTTMIQRNVPRKRNPNGMKHSWREGRCSFSAQGWYRAHGSRRVRRNDCRRTKGLFEVWPLSPGPGSLQPLVRVTDSHWGAGSLGRGPQRLASRAVGDPVFSSGLYRPLRAILDAQNSHPVRARVEELTSMRSDRLLV